MNLEDIRREAEQLEIDVDTTEGFLDLYRRSDREHCFSSFRSADDPAMIHAAWIWLQNYRRRLSSLDQHRAQIQYKSRKNHIREIVLWLIIILECAVVLSLYRHFLDTRLCIVAFFTLLVIAAMVIGPNKRGGRYG
jgi:hypothetical protein